MTFLTDSQVNSLSKSGDTTEKDLSPVSKVKEDSFRPCRLSEGELRRYIKHDCESGIHGDDGEMFIYEDYVMEAYDGYFFAGIDLMLEFEEALNRVADLAVQMAYHNAVHGNTPILGELSGVEEMSNAAMKAEEYIRERLM
ncbi:hypothetical protein KQ304_04310 [Synechococcus sp. CS-1329]|uniref:hypothetical protein n=1 Tax=Synechococcus sp. CS-1329 TaxID=2847975 RepID=UPI00223B0A7A|nr:hypothetical protein [Synechococcus sp. CS-1329]MCT0218229.1 hypothetical protein [Synechococcus sp. CS-1329]